MVSAALALCALASFGAGLWLVLNLPMLARMLSRDIDIIAPSWQLRPPRGKVIALLLLFNAGWIACLLIWTFLAGTP